METLYSALQDEIHAFEEHMKRCQKSFDLHTLYNVLLLLSQSQSRELTSLEQLERLMQGQDTMILTASDENWDVPGYISWLSTYLGYLNSLKETFDGKVVFPLCEHLYVNDALDAGAEFQSPMASHSCSGSGPRVEMRPCSVTSIAAIAKQLFTIRRKWALLLNGSVIDERIFSHQSLRDLQGFANVSPFVKVLRLVPDIFHKSLATAALARQWVSIHGSRYSSRLPPYPGQEDERRTGLAPGTSTSGFSGGRLHPRPKQSSSSGADDSGDWSRNGTMMRTQLRESREELMFLLWRAERASVLETQLHERTQHICSLQWDKNQLDIFQQKLEQEDGDMPGSIRLLSSECQATLRQVEELGRRLALEEYHKSILQSDWLLELELRPLLIRQIDTLQQRCHKLEQLLQTRDQATLEPLLPASGTDSASLCDSGHCSTMSATNRN